MKYKKFHHRLNPEAAKIRALEAEKNKQNNFIWDSDNNCCLLTCFTLYACVYVTDNN